MEDFNFYDYDSNATIGYLKEYFLTTFGHKYKKCCKCLLSLYSADKRNFNLLLNDDNSRKLMECKYDKLFLVKVGALCDCEFKMYNKYINMNKFDLITKIKELEAYNIDNQQKIEDLFQRNKNENLKNLDLQKINETLEKEKTELNSIIKKLKKTEELNNFKNHNLEENFYDVVIDINSITSVSTEGWSVKFNPEIKKNFRRN